jgi:hypothetical protein
LPEVLEDVTRKDETFKQILNALVSDQKMKQLGTTCPCMLLVPTTHFKCVRAAIRSGQEFLPSDILVGRELDAKFQQIIHSFRRNSSFAPVLSFKVGRDTPGDRVSQQASSAGSPSEVEAQWDLLQRQPVESDNDVSDQDDSVCDTSFSGHGQTGAQVPDL